MSNSGGIKTILPPWSPFPSGLSDNFSGWGPRPLFVSIFHLSLGGNVKLLVFRKDASPGCFLQLPPQGPKCHDPSYLFTLRSFPPHSLYPKHTNVLSSRTSLSLMLRPIAVPSAWKSLSIISLWYSLSSRSHLKPQLPRETRVWVSARSMSTCPTLPSHSF